LTADDFPALVSRRRHLHKYPELSFHEHETAKRIAKELESIGIPTFSGIAVTGVIGVIEGAKPGKTIGIRAELDALPIDEKTNLDYASANPGVMHACGHDIHMANLIGAAKVLWELRNEISGKILLIFQPGEELLPGGAKSIMESEVFKQNQPDMMMGLHILPELPIGKVGFRAGPYMASGDEIYVKVGGKGGHAALPQTYNNPIPIASQIIVALQQGVKPKDNSEISSILAFGKVEAKGATNVIPNEVAIEGTFRTMDEEWRRFAHKEIERIATTVAESFGATCEVEIKKGYPSLINDPELTNCALSLSREILGDQNVVELPLRMTTDDFAYYSLQIPSVYFRLGVGIEGKETESLHSSSLNVDDNVLKQSVGVTVWLTINILSKYQ